MSVSEAAATPQSHAVPSAPESGAAAEAIVVPIPTDTGAAPPGTIDFWSHVERTFPATGYGAVGAFFALAQHTYDEPMGGCMPPPLVPMVHHAQVPVEINKALVAVMAAPTLQTAAGPITFDGLVKLKPTEVPLAGLPLYVGLTQNTKDPMATYLGTLMLRKLVAVESEPPIDAVLESGVLPRLVELVRPDSIDDAGTSTAEALLQHRLLFEAAWALTNIASGTSDHTKHVVAAGAVPHFIEHIRKRTTEDIVEQCTWAIGNIAGDGVATRDYCLAQGAATALAECITGMVFTKSTTLRNAVWASSNLCRAKPPAHMDSVLPLVPVFAHLLNHHDDEVVADAAWGMSYISDGPQDRIQVAVNAGVVPRLVQLLSSPSPQQQLPAIRTIGNIVTGSDLQTQLAIDCGALAAFPFLLAHPKRAIQKEACWTLSNITAGNKEQIQAVIDANLLPPVLAQLGSAFFDVKKEATWAIANATSGGTREQLEYMRSIGAVPNLFDVAQVYDVKVASVALEALGNLVDASVEISERNERHPCTAEVEACDGFNILSRLAHHGTSTIAALAMELLEKLGAEADGGEGQEGDGEGEVS